MSKDEGLEEYEEVQGELKKKEEEEVNGSNKLYIFFSYFFII